MLILVFYLRKAFMVSLYFSIPSFFIEIFENLNTFTAIKINKNKLSLDTIIMKCEDVAIKTNLQGKYYTMQEDQILLQYLHYPRKI